MILTPAEQLTLRLLLKNCSRSQQDVLSRLLQAVNVQDEVNAELRHRMQLFEEYLLKILPPEHQPVAPENPPHIRQMESCSPSQT